MKPRSRTPRKILVASIGVATMSYVVVSCGGSEQPVANLVANFDAMPLDAADGATGDTAAPPDAVTTETIDEFPVANLVARPDH